MDYPAFLASKAPKVEAAGFEADVCNAQLFPWQAATVRWACELGRAALFEDTGLGKSRQALEWGSQVARHTNGRILLLTPVAVGPQFLREAEAANIDGAQLVRRQEDVSTPISITNYERLHLFDPSAFVGVVLDESSNHKSYMGTTKRTLVSSFAETPYRLACTATPAPNDHLELGNHSEMLSILDSHRMIARWFITADNKAGAYRLKGHAVESFWDWVCSWARLVGRPSDLGPQYSDAGYVLPELYVEQHSVGVDLVEGRDDGQLLRLVEASATALHAERRRTTAARADRVAELVTQRPNEPWVIWVETNYDADAIRARLPEAIEVRGSDDADEKEARLTAFTEGRERVLITKPSIAGFGLNWQHVADQVFAGPSYSYERFYQAVRRSWRFGQTRPVRAHVVLAKTEQAVWAALSRKAADHEAMKAGMFAASRRAQARTSSPDAYHPRVLATLPPWIRSAA